MSYQRNFFKYSLFISIITHQNFRIHVQFAKPQAWVGSVLHNDSLRVRTRHHLHMLFASTSLVWSMARKSLPRKPYHISEFAQLPQAIFTLLHQHNQISRCELKPCTQKVTLVLYVSTTLQPLHHIPSIYIGNLTFRLAKKAKLHTSRGGNNKRVKRSWTYASLSCT